MDAKQVIKGFFPEDELLSCAPHGNGHINDTYKARTKEHGALILQRINERIFPDVDGLMRNIAGVTEHIGKIRLNAGERPENILKLFPTAAGAPYLRLDDGCYRIYNFIENADVEGELTPELFRLSGVGFGQFQINLANYPAKDLVETIPNFHNTRSRFDALKRAAQADVKGRKKEIQAELDSYLSRERYVDRVLDGIASGKLPLRVTHNDTKLNNVLLSPDRTRPLAVIDLDTVMPGSVLYDFGDSVRFGASTGAEDEPDLKKVNFSPEMFTAFCSGFLPEIAPTLTGTEVDLMAFGALLMTYECGMRFLTDYLEGDVYFKIHRPEHNLLRARTQLKLVKDMEAQLPAMTKIVSSFVRAPHVNERKR